LIIENVYLCSTILFNEMFMSESSDFSGLSKVYEESGKVRISLEGKKFNKIRKYAEENFEQFWAEQAKHLVWFKEWDKILDP
jgi:acetyl-CoA synthetase